MKSDHRSTLSHTQPYRTSTDAPCRNRTYNLMIKSQILGDLTVEGTPRSPSYSSASLVQRTPPEDAPKFHDPSHGVSRPRPSSGKRELPRYAFGVSSAEHPVRFDAAGEHGGASRPASTPSRLKSLLFVFGETMEGQA